jgi:hypothetical protein
MLHQLFAPASRSPYTSCSRISRHRKTKTPTWRVSARSHNHPPTGHHAPAPGASVKVKPLGCCATLTPLVVVAPLACRLRGNVEALASPREWTCTAGIATIAPRNPALDAGSRPAMAGQTYEPPVQYLAVPFITPLSLMSAASNQFQLKMRIVISCHATLALSSFPQNACVKPPSLSWTRVSCLRPKRPRPFNVKLFLSTVEVGRTLSNFGKAREKIFALVTCERKPDIHLPSIQME